MRVTALYVLNAVKRFKDKKNSGLNSPSQEIPVGVWIQWNGSSGMVE